MLLGVKPKTVIVWSISLEIMATIWTQTTKIFLIGIVSCFIELATWQKEGPRTTVKEIDVLVIAIGNLSLTFRFRQK